MNQQTTETWLGALFVLLHAVTQFNKPPTNRTSTTAARYWAATLAYCALLVGFYVLLVVALGTQFFTQELGNTVKDLPTPLLAALLLTILLPTLPLLKDFDQWSRHWLQTIALIPHEARRLSTEMRRASFSFTPTQKQHVLGELARQGFTSFEPRFEKSDTPEYVWTNVTALMLHLRDWETDRRFSGFLTAFSEDYERIKRQYEQLALKVRRWFASVRDLSMAEEMKAASLARYYQAELLEQCTELHQSLCIFVSHGILKCELTFSSRIARLRALGFVLAVNHQKLTLNRIMLLFGSVSVVLLFGFVSAGALAGGDSMRTVLTRTVMVAIIYSVAVCCAIVPKEWWPAARRAPDGDRPVAFYFLSSVVAGLASLPISFLFWFLITLDVTKAFEEWSVRYPWVLLTFASAFITAWLADNETPAPGGRMRSRILEGGTQATVALLTSVLVRRWLGEMLPPTDPDLPPWPLVLSLTPIIGFVIGFLVPTWYREAPRERASCFAGDVSSVVSQEASSLRVGAQ